MATELDQNPFDFLNNKHDFIYFNSLADNKQGSKYYQQAYSYYNTGFLSNIRDPGNASIKNGLAFLKRIIDAEAAKETNFINYIRKSIDGIGIQVPTQKDDWTGFVRQAQVIMKGHSDQLENFKAEIQRIRQQSTPTKNGYYNIEESAITMAMQAIQATNKLVTGTAKETSNTDKVWREFLAKIIDKYKKELFNIDGNTISLNPSTAGVILSLASGFLMQSLEEQLVEKTNNIERFFTTIKTINDNMDQYDKQITRAVEHASEIIKLFNGQSNLANVLLQSLGITVSSRVKQNLDVTSAEELFGKLIQQTKGKRNTASQNQRALITFTQKASNVGELSSLISQAIQEGVFYAANTGKTGAKPDNIIGFLQIKPEKTSTQSEGYIKLIKELQDKMQEIVSTLKSTNSTAYYQQQQKNWSRIEQRIAELIKEVDFVQQCFIIEDSTKAYQNMMTDKARSSMSQDSWIYQHSQGGFHGGSLGPNLQDQIARIAALTGDSDMADSKNQEWLMWTIRNSAENMIAGSMRKKITDYFSTFAAILMFDDQFQIAAQAQIENAQNTVGVTVQHIHLFSLNNGMYPLSYVLNLTYQHLDHVYNQFVGEPAGYVEVEITGYPSFRKINEKDAEDVVIAKTEWNKTLEAAQNPIAENVRSSFEAVRNEAIQSVKLKMYIINRFAAIIDSLYST